MRNPHFLFLLLEGAKCQLCPVDWTLQKKRCYWFSKDEKEWLWAYSDCAGKRAQMLVKLDLEEMVRAGGNSIQITIMHTSIRGNSGAVIELQHGLCPFKVLL